MSRLFLITLLLCSLCNIANSQGYEPLKIVEKSRPIFRYKDAGKVCVQGTVRLRVEFLNTAEIGEVEILYNLPFGIAEDAVEAARKIKFEPARNNDLPITVKRTVEYGFLWGSFTNFRLVEVASKQSTSKVDEKADVIINKAVARLGGEKYLNAKTVVRRGNYSQIEDGVAISSSPFVDYIALPDKERTDFKFASGAIIQTNVGEKGWIYEAGARAINDQNSTQIENYKQSLRTSLDYFLRGTWRGEKGAKVEYFGKRRVNLGNQNDVVVLSYDNGLKVEFEFEANGTPAKLSYERKNSDGVKIIEEDRFAQFIEINGVFAPFIIDRYRDDKQISRLNYTSIEINTPISNALFDKPANIKKLKISK